MPIKAIVYTSNSGFTKQYAEMLGEKISLPIYSLKEVPRQISKGDGIIYLGWICANHIKGFSRAAKRFSVRTVLPKPSRLRILSMNRSPMFP